jgi:hypothetical protein
MRNHPPKQPRDKKTDLIVEGSRILDFVDGRRKSDFDTRRETLKGLFLQHKKLKNYTHDSFHFSRIQAFQPKCDIDCRPLKAHRGKTDSSNVLDLHLQTASMQQGERGE